MCGQIAWPQLTYWAVATPQIAELAHYFIVIIIDLLQKKTTQQQVNKKKGYWSAMK